MKLKDAVKLYLKHLQALGRSYDTLRTATYSLKAFARFLTRQQITDVEEITEEIMEAYQLELAFHPTIRGSLPGAGSQAFTLGKVKGFTRFLNQSDYLISDPAKKIRMPKPPKRLPKSILSPAEVKRLLNAPDMRTRLGYRDRVVLEILYDTAVRRAELVNIKLGDLDLQNGYIRIRGKGGKERVVPSSTRVCEMIRNYILGIRSSFLPKDRPDDGYLFLSRRLRKMNDRTILYIVKRHAKRAGVKKNVTAHGLRHTCATHMLKNGAPIRQLQEMLGHESLESTQIYTRVTISELKEIHAKYHPSETLPDLPD
jgi:integrase/recombinase XerD